LQTGINAVLVCIHPCACNDGGFDQGLDGFLLHVGQEMDDHLTATLQHPKDGRSVLLQGATTSFALEPASTSWASLALDHLRLSFMAGNHIGFVALHFIGERHRRLFFTIPSRSCAVICCTSLPLSANSWAICSFDKLSPMK